jgi:hypothetical protein
MSRLESERVWKEKGLEFLGTITQSNMEIEEIRESIQDGRAPAIDCNLRPSYIQTSSNHLHVSLFYFCSVFYNASSYV